MGVRWRRLAPALVIAIVASGCAQPERQTIASGSISSGEWAARVYEDPFNGACLEIVQLGGRTAVCGLGPRNSSILVTDPVDPGEDYLVVVDDRDGAASVEVRMDAGTLEGQLVAVPGSAMRFSFVPVPGSRTIESIAWLDGSGAVIDSQSMR